MRKERVTSFLNEVLRFNFEKPDNKRSSKRTDLLHHSFIEAYLENKTGFEVKYEHNLSCFYGDTFTVDAIVYKDDQIDTVFLFKMFQTSILKNLFNSLNTKAGELIRLTGSVEYHQKPFNIVFCEILPTETLVVSKKQNRFTTENIFKRLNKINDLRNHILLKNITNIYDFKIWFKPNNNFFEAVKNNLNYQINSKTDFIEEVQYDISHLP